MMRKKLTYLDYKNHKDTMYDTVTIYHTDHDTVEKNEKVNGTSTEKQKKKVSFFPYTKIHEIPNRDHLNDYQLIPIIWYNQQDYTLFRNQSMYEISMFHRMYPRFHEKTIRQILYQP
jgi:hypothetical protein